MEILEHANKLLDKKRELYEISNQLDRKVLEYNEHLRALEYVSNVNIDIIFLERKKRLSPLKFRSMMKK